MEWIKVVGPYGAALVAAVFTAWIATRLERGRYERDSKKEAYVKYLQAFDARDYAWFAGKPQGSNIKKENQDLLMAGTALQFVASDKIKNEARELNKQWNAKYGQFGNVDSITQSEVRQKRNAFQQSCRADIGKRNRKKISSE